MPGKGPPAVRGAEERQRKGKAILTTTLEEALKATEEEPTTRHPAKPRDSRVPPFPKFPNTGRKRGQKSEQRDEKQPHSACPCPMEFKLLSKLLCLGLHFLICKMG
jgi:hypothetical protein